MPQFKAASPYPVSLNRVNYRTDNARIYTVAYELCTLCHRSGNYGSCRRAEYQIEHERVFILWFGWYGFNGAAATSTDNLAQIFLTTTIAPAVAIACCEKTYRKRAPDTVAAVNRHSADRVVYLKHVVQQPYAEAYQQTRS